MTNRTFCKPRHYLLTSTLALQLLLLPAANAAERIEPNLNAAEQALVDWLPPREQDMVDLLEQLTVTNSGSMNKAGVGEIAAFFSAELRQLEYGQVLQTPFYEVDRKDLIRTFHEFTVPADAVADDGYLAVGFFNPPSNNTVVIFPFDEGLRVLYRTGSFLPNFIRANVLILFRLIFLACLGTFTATFLSFPVAILFCLTVFVTGTMSQFCLESFDYLSADIGNLYRYTLRPFVQLLPQFDKFNPAKFLVPAELLGWTLLVKVFVVMICIKAMLLLLFALLIFNYKEINVRYV